MPKSGIVASFMREKPRLKDNGPGSIADNSDAFKQYENLLMILTHPN